MDTIIDYSSPRAHTPLARSLSPMRRVARAPRNSPTGDRWRLRTSRPLAQARSGPRLTHRLPLEDESTPTRRARPAGVRGAEVWVKLVNADQPAPADPAVHSFLTMTIRPRVRAEFRAGDEGKTAVYMLR